MADNGGHEKRVLVSTERLAEHLGDENVVAAEVDENPAPTRRGTSRARSSCTGATTSRIRSSAT